MLGFLEGMSTSAKIYDVEEAERHQTEMEAENMTLKGGDGPPIDRLATQSGSHDEDESHRHQNPLQESIASVKVLHEKDALIFELDPELFRLISYVSFWIMMLLSGVITQLTVDVPTPNPLEKTFGYSNICLYFDYDPPRIVAAMYYPIVEYSMVMYIVLNWMSVRRVFDMTKKNERMAYRAFSIMSAIEIIFIAWFRMVFVIRAFVNLTGHTLPFIGLQITLCMISVQNCIFYYFLHDGEIDYSDLYHWGSQKVLGILAYVYTGFLVAVTLAKIVLTGSVLDGHPVMTIGTPTQKAVGSFFDTAWVILAAVIPLLISLYLVFKKGKPKAVISFA